MFDAPWHWVVVALVALILFFGWKQLPDMARSLGRSLRLFKTEMKGMAEDDKARDAHTQPEPTEPKALPRAEIVRNDVPKSRPRPAPGPNGSAPRSEPRAGAQ